MTSVPARPTRTASCAVVDKWFRDAEGKKFFWQGVTYGPFKPDALGRPWPLEAQVAADFAHIVSLGCNTIRLYEPPADFVVQAATASGLRLLCGVPWTQHVDFMAQRELRADALRRVTEEARRLSQHGCVCGLLVGNEIEKTLVRWMGPARVQRFLEELIDAAHAVAPSLPVSYATYPSTEYLIPRNADFVAFNVFLEDARGFGKYLQHLQILADGKPLVIAEFGLDAKKHGEQAQADAMKWQRSAVTDAAIAGNIWFSYTDEWHRGGEEVTDWNFGLVTRDRKPKPVCTSFSEVHPSSFIPHPSKISVVVCTRNGASTLHECLTALARQTHPHHEIIVVDDGSTDATGEIAQSFPDVRYVRQEQRGLSAARNLGAQHAQGEIVAYTDDDCIPDEDWLLHLARAFEHEKCVAAGGPNLPPAPRARTESVVALAPGAPSEVLISDVEAEHLPGCNLAIRKSALDAIGGFRELFTAAGDDVDICWRLQAADGKLLFVPAAVVWHHRRASVGAYLRQQRGYGRAEALLIKQHPERFAWFGGARWRGAIYGSSTSGDVSDLVIDHGPFGSALFPTVYANQSPDWPQRCTGVPALLLSLIALGVGVIFKPALLISAMLFGSSIVAAFLITRRRWIRRGRNTKRGILLLWLMCWLQPIVRDWARFRGMIALGAWPRARRTSSGSLKISGGAGRRGSREHSVWIEDASVASDFSALLRSSCAKRRISCAVLNQPTSGWDFVIRCEGLRASVTCVTEYHERGRRLLRARCSRPRGPLWMVGLMFLPLVAAEAAHVMIYPPRRFGCGNWMLDYFLMQSALTILLMALSIWATGRLYSVVREALEAAASSAKNTDHPA